MKFLQLTGVALLGVGLVACGNSGSSGGDDSGTQDEGVFDPLVDTIDRAEAIEDIGLERKDQLDEALDQ